MELNEHLHDRVVERLEQILNNEDFSISKRITIKSQLDTLGGRAMVQLGSLRSKSSRSVRTYAFSGPSCPRCDVRLIAIV